MIKTIYKFVSFILIFIIVCFTLVACNDSKPDIFEIVQSYGKSSLSKYLRPIWNTPYVYDETGVIVGENGSFNLLYEPKGEIVVRDYELQKTYVEGIDYYLEGNKITRISSGNMPFWKVDEFYMDEPHPSVEILATSNEFGFTENKYLPYGDETFFTCKQICVSYVTESLWTGNIPEQDERVKDFVKKIKENRGANIMFYGDSITVGWTASGTQEGGIINPFVPNSSQLIEHFLENKYRIPITTYNRAEGGWGVEQGKVNFEKRVVPIAGEIDLLVLAFGMNDKFTSAIDYSEFIKEMVDNYREINPEGFVLLVSTMLPNTQSNWLGNQPLFENALYEVAQEYEKGVGVAPVTTLFKDFENMGKRTRDILANNVNHPNDFGHRAYAQVILKALLGKDFEK